MSTPASAIAMDAQDNAAARAGQTKKRHYILLLCFAKHMKRHQILFQCFASKNVNSFSLLQQCKMPGSDFPKVFWTKPWILGMLFRLQWCIPRSSEMSLGPLKNILKCCGETVIVGLKRLLFGIWNFQNFGNLLKKWHLWKLQQNASGSGPNIIRALTTSIVLENSDIHIHSGLGELFLQCKSITDSMQSCFYPSLLIGALQQCLLIL